MIHSLIRTWIPETIRAPLQLRYLVHKEWKRGEREVRLLPALVDSRRAAYDVGANRGVYSWYLRRLVPAVHAFEPQPEMARRLQRAFRGSVQVHHVAVSNRRGSATLRVPFAGRTRIDLQATLQSRRSTEAAWQESWSERCIEVQAVPLDDLDLPAPGFLKIDVEGHEAEVLEGAWKTLEKQQPVLLIELEERNRPGAVEGTSLTLARLGYRGYFLLGKELVDLARFEKETHQNPRFLLENGIAPGKVYIHNFVFLPQPDAASRARRVAASSEL